MVRSINTRVPFDPRWLFTGYTKHEEITAEPVTMRVVERISGVGQAVRIVGYKWPPKPVLIRLSCLLSPDPPVCRSVRSYPAAHVNNTRALVILLMSGKGVSNDLPVQC